MRILTAVLFLAAALLAVSGRTEPENVLVEGYTFVRPTNWIWEAPADKSKVLNRFLVPGKAADPATDVGFFYVSGVQEELRTRVIGNFAKGASFTQTSTNIGKANLTYVRVDGRTILRKNGVDYQLFGVMLHSKDKDKWFFARIFGPRVEVQAAQVDFRKMIERAVEDAAE